MGRVYEVSTVNGRTFRVFVDNANQEKRLNKKIEELKKKSYEKVSSVKIVTEGIHNISAFEKVVGSLV